MEKDVKQDAKTIIDFGKNIFCNSCIKINFFHIVPVSIDTMASFFILFLFCKYRR